MVGICGPIGRFGGSVKKFLVLVPALASLATVTYTGTQRVQANVAESTSSRQTTAVVDATSAFLKSLSADQRQKVQFAFTPQKLGANAPFHRTADGGVAPGAPAGGQQAGAGGPGRGPGGPGAPGGLAGQMRGPGGPGGPGGKQ